MNINKTAFKLVLGLIILMFLNASKLYSQSAQVNTNEHSEIWHDLLTPEINKSMEFYKNMFNWSYEFHNVKGFKYAIIKNNEKIIGGIIEAHTLKSSVWVSSLLVSPQDMKRKVELIQSNKGELMIPPIKVPGMGKQLVFKGPQNETFSLKSFSKGAAKVIDNNIGNGDWLGIELWSSNTDSASKFYGKVFNVTTEKQSYDNKPYWFFNKNGKPVAGMMTNPSTSTPDQWVPYICVDDVVKTSEVVNTNGGDLIIGPDSSIRNGSLSIAQDPFGAIFCLQMKTKN